MSSSEKSEWDRISDCQFLKKIKEGGYGKVFLVKNKNGEREVIKAIPKIKNGRLDQSFKQEVEALNALRGLDAVVEMRCSDSATLISYRFIVLELLDVTVDELRRKNETKTFKPITTLQILWELVNIFEAIHLRCFFHRDTMLSNLMMKYTPEFSMMKIVDFGLACSFTDATKPSAINFIEGTFSSPLVSQGHPFKCSEEMISIALLAVHLASGSVPWGDSNSQMMLEKKIKFLEKPEFVLPQGAHYIIPFITATKKLTYGDAVDYHKLRKILSAEYIARAKKVVNDMFGVKMIDGNFFME
uniref:Protein kinase domain-containing protein n=1 Tax=Caenorhabditis tropicalis TaxID=1561998 RepID=A0A1I7TLC0_9PELO